MKPQKLKSVPRSYPRLEGVSKLSVERVPGGVWCLFADHEPLTLADLRRVVLDAEALSSVNPEIPLDTQDLSPRGIAGTLIKTRRVGQAEVRYFWQKVTFQNADTLYRHLLNGGFRFWAPDFVAEDDSGRQQLYRSHDTVASMTAWEIALHRLENDGALPDFLEVPAGTCPRCLSEFVAIPEGGQGYHCLECHYVH